VDVVVAIFGIIKAGAAYLPLDPECVVLLLVDVSRPRLTAVWPPPTNRTPKERVWQIARDANVATIVTQRAKADVLYAGHGTCPC
jgi:hypothetical protein